jgi:hypothetical protein
VITPCDVFHYKQCEQLAQFFLRRCSRQGLTASVVHAARSAKASSDQNHLPRSPLPRPSFILSSPPRRSRSPSSARSAFDHPQIARSVTRSIRSFENFFFGGSRPGHPKKVQAGCGLALSIHSKSPRTFALRASIGPRQTDRTRRFPFQELSTGPRECPPRFANSEILARDIFVAASVSRSESFCRAAHRASDSGV